MKTLSTGSLLRRLTCVCTFLTLATFSFAQHYDFAASSTTYAPVTGGTDVDDIEVDDELSADIPLGFTFTFFGSDYTMIKASSNGYITFNLSDFDDYSNSIPDDFKSKVVAPLWDDLGGSGGIARYATTGTAGSRVFTFEWNNWRWNRNSTAAISFQVKLYETSNQIEFLYKQETGVLNLASASIGLLHNATEFYVLSDASAAPAFSPNGFNNIDSKPATGQKYTFVPGTASAITPTVQASNISVVDNAGDEVSISWTNGDGGYRAVFVKQTSATETVTLSDGTFYAASEGFGDELVSSGWYCVYNGSGSSAIINGLGMGIPYRLQVVEYNGLTGAQKYLSSPATDNPTNVNTILVAPGNPISSLAIYRVSGTEVTMNLTEGDGEKRAIFMKAGNSGTAPTVNNTTYTANTLFGTGSQIGSTGWYCVFNGTSSFDFTVTGLSGNTDYMVHVIDYNGPTGSETYNIDSGTDNPVQFKTFEDIPSIDYVFAASAGSFAALSGATIIEDIDSDDALGAAIPIGFTFRFAGVPFDEVFPSSNGFISFNPFANDVGSSSFNDLESGQARPVIAPLWDDLSGSGGTASYLTTGSSPNRVFTIEYRDWRWDWGSAANISFQVKLYETSNKIEFIYQQEGSGIVSSGAASIGLAFPNFNTGNYLSLSDLSATPTVSSSLETSTVSAPPANGQVYTFTPQKLDQTITFNSISDKFFGNDFSLSATATSGLPITYTSSNTNVATISGDEVSFTGVGSVTITAVQTGNDVYNAAPEVQQTFVVNKGDQTISFTLTSPVEYDLADFELEGTASSGLTVTYESSNAAVATISGSMISIVGVGTADITAKQAGDANYNAATDVVRTLAVEKADQAITFPSFTVRTVGDAPFTLEATASSGLALTYTSSNTAVATINGNTLTIVGHGTTSITASQAGNENYEAATDVLQALVVRSTQTITFDEIPSKLVGDVFTINATATSGLPVSFSSTTGNVSLTINGNDVTVDSGAGLATITATQSGDANYHAAEDVNRTFCVNPPKPEIQLNIADIEHPQLLVSHNTGLDFQWYRNGVVIEGATAATFDPLDAGTYTFTQSAEGCTSELSNPISLIITGIEVLDHGVRIFPNPTMNELIVDVTSLTGQRSEVTIFDVTGKRIAGESASGVIKFNTSSYKPGNYILNISNGHRSISKQIIKK